MNQILMLHNDPLSKTQHEQLAGCLSMGNSPETCYLGIYGKRDARVGGVLSRMGTISGRTEYLRSIGTANGDLRQSEA